MLELKGTEKQIKWGKSIRKEIIENCEKEINFLEGVQDEKVSKGKKRNKTYDKKIAKLKEIIEEVSNIEFAKILIEECRIKYSEYEIKRSFFM